MNMSSEKALEFAIILAKENMPNCKMFNFIEHKTQISEELETDQGEIRKCSNA